MFFMIDIASRVYNHNWKIDPIVRSLLDVDFYKLLMAQFVLRNAPDVSVKFSVLNRSSKVLLADVIDEQELREQLNHIRDLSLSKGEVYLVKRKFILWEAGYISTIIHRLARKT